jgi:ring-1,2-phenylacetyl-CoA epoxidase subunit PaaD
VVTEEQIWQLLQEVKDPEVPVLSIIDLGIVRDVKVVTTEASSLEGQGLTITITPTYSGCPAMDVISMDIRLKLMEKGYRKVTIKQQLSPAWTTDWMSTEGREKLKAYGSAPAVIPTIPNL